MGRLSQAAVDRIVELHTMRGMAPEQISETTGSSVKTVNKILSVLEEVQDEVVAAEDEEESDIDWKARYLDAHVKLIENGLE